MTRRVVEKVCTIKVCIDLLAPRRGKRGGERARKGKRGQG